jgi:diguanylate cyclase (GGDEF)-like protein/PAS domain S-box-containing protein
MGGLLLARGVLHSGLLGLSPSLHRQVVEQIPDAVLVVDGAGHVVDANPAAEQMLEDRATALTGAPVARLLPEAPIEELADDRQQSAEITLNGRAYHLRSSVLEPGENEARQTVVIFRDITERLETENELRQVHQELERLAHTDPLTGLHNRRYFMQRLHQEVERVRRSGHALSVLLLDLDRFKSINDTHGHAIGDRVLQRVAEVLADGGRASDVAARLGGEEFALLLPETPIDGALRLAERLRRVVAEQLVRDGHREPVAVTTSVGVATLSPAAPGADELLRQADMALYQAKRGGRNAVGCA